MDNYNNTPEYFWYTSQTPPEGEYRCHFYNGQWYGAYMTDPEPNLIDKHGMTFVGVGGITFPQEYTKDVKQAI